MAKSDYDKLADYIVKSLPGEQMVDIAAPSIVEVQVRADGKVLWVNVDGICRFRCCRIETIIVNDERESLNG